MDLSIIFSQLFAEYEHVTYAKEKYDHPIFLYDGTVNCCLSQVGDVIKFRRFEWCSDKTKFGHYRSNNLRQHWHEFSGTTEPQKLYVCDDGEIWSYTPFISSTQTLFLTPGMFFITDFVVAIDTISRDGDKCKCGEIWFNTMYPKKNSFGQVHIVTKFLSTASIKNNL